MVDYDSDSSLVYLEKKKQREEQLAMARRRVQNSQVLR
jgi:hypothetical protein